MFKKIAFFILLSAVGASCFSQDHIYISPLFSNKFDFGQDYKSYDITVDLHHCREISDVLWSRFSYGIGMRFINGTFGPIFNIGYGVGLNVSNFYGLIDFNPVIKCVGNGHQVNGDEISFGIIPKLGIGYNWFITDDVILFGETGFYKEFDIIYTSDDLKINSFGIYLNIGFKFKHI